MYRRFLNNDDYLGIITPEALAQLTRGNDARFIQAEESAEMSIVEYLSQAALHSSTGFRIFQRIIRRL